MEGQWRHERRRLEKRMREMKRMEEEQTEPMEDYVRDPEDREEERIETQKVEEPTQLIDDSLEYQEADNVGIYSRITLRDIFRRHCVQQCAVLAYIASSLIHSCVVASRTNLTGTRVIATRT